MSAEIKQPQIELEWLASPLHPVHAPGRELDGWLTYRGLLTVRLKSACLKAFRLQLLDDGNGPGLLIDEMLIRRVVLWCGNVPCVYAETHLPLQTLTEVPRLRSLGNDPLGEALQNHPNVSRSEFEYALIDAPRLPAPLEMIPQGPLWARRSKFKTGQSSLMVAEVFLPGIVEIQAGPAR